MQIFVQSFLNAGTILTIEIEPSDSIENLRSFIQVQEDIDTNLMKLFFNNTLLEDGRTLSDYNIQSESYIKTSNAISTLATKELRQKAKLDLAAAKRAADGSPRATYDITQLPTQYNDNGIVDNPNTNGLVLGRPWINTVAAFTFFETFGTTEAISTTQFVSGNKIFALSSTFDVPGVPNARVVVNDIEVLNEGDGTERGHHLVVLDSYGDLISATRYDTFDTNFDGGVAGRAALNTALGTVTSGNIVVLVVYDASSFDATLRSTINTGYGSTNSNIWTASRVSHIFIGEKI